MKPITAPNLPTPAGHYSHAARTGNLLFISGQLPTVPQGGPFPVGVKAQTIQALENVQAILAAQDASLENLVSVQVYITDVEHWPVVNEVYAELLGAHRPARVIVPCGPLHHGALVEIAAVAELTGDAQ